MRIDNPGWDFLVAKGIIARLGDAEPDLFQDSEQALRDFITRKEYCLRFAYTIASPETLEFVAEHSLGHVLDPMAGTGYWACLLRQHGVDVKATDLHPDEENRLAAFDGSVLLYLGETRGGACGSDAFWDEIKKRWTLTASMTPPQFAGIHDVVLAFERS